MKFIILTGMSGAGKSGFRLVFYGGGRFGSYVRHRAVCKFGEHVVMVLLVFGYLSEQAFQFGVLCLLGIKIVFLQAKFLLIFQLGDKLSFFLIKFHFAIYARRR